MYRLTKFGTVSLDYYNQVDPIGSGETPVSYQALPDGGALDGFGRATKHPGAVERVKTVRLYGLTRSQLESRYFELLSMRGKRDLLFRRTAAGDEHWIYARMASVEGENNFSLARFKFFQDLALRFITQEAAWHGEHLGSWFLDSGVYLGSGYELDAGEAVEMTSSPFSFTVYNGSSAANGRAPVRAMQIIVTTGSAGIDAGTLSISRSGGETLEFSAAMAASKQLVINTGTMQVTLDGADAYDDLDFTATADMATWFSLEPGPNTITVEFTKSGAGDNPTIEFIFDEAWY